MEAPPPPPPVAVPRSPLWWLRVAGGAVLAIALSIALGWVTGRPALTEWLPHGASSVINAAACLALAGLGLLALTTRLRRFAALCGAAMLLFALAVLTRRLFGWWPGLDDLLWTHQWGAVGLPRGQMAPNTAVAFILIGASLIVLALRRRAVWLLPMTAGVVIALALLPLLRFAAESLTAQGDFNYRGMALPTALGLLLIAASLLETARREAAVESLAQSFLAAALGMLISIGLVTIQANADLVAAENSVAHTYEVRGSLDRLVSEVARMESTVRAYGLTAEDFFRARFDVHKEALLSKVAVVRRLVVDNPLQRGRAEQLQALAERKIEQSAALLRAGEAGGQDGAARYLRSLDRKDTSALVVLTETMWEEENRLLAVREATQQVAERDTHAVQILGGIIALGLLFAAIVVARRSADARRVAEDRVRRSEEKLRLLVGNVRDFAFYLLDPQGRVTTWNAGAARIKGYTVEEAIGLDFAQFFTPEDRAAGVPAQLLAEALAHGRYEGRGWRVRKDGTRFFAEIVLMPLRDERGELLGFAKTVYDITERTRAETALRESEVRFRHAFEDAGVGMALVGLDGRWLRVNRALCDIVGYTPGELLKGSFQDITHPDDIATDLDHVRGLVEGRARTYHLEKRYLHRDGHVVWINLTVSVVRDASGAPVHFISQIEDITARKQLEVQLRAARDDALAARDELAATNRLHRAVIDGNEFSIVAVRLDGVIEVFNRGAEQMLGYAAAEVLGRSTLELIHVPEEIRARASELSVQLHEPVAPNFEALVAFARRGTADNREWTYVRKGGSRLPVRVSLTALRDEQDAITGFVAIAQDLTRRKEIEVALQASEERLLQVLGKADCLVWEAQVHLRGDDWDWHFVVQPSALYRRLFGDDPAGESAGLWYRFDIPEQAEMNRRSRAAILGGLPGYEQEFRILRDGRVAWIRESVSITQPEPGRCWLVGVATDITERKRLEENLAKARDDALAASRLKSEFLATMSHEVRTPMNGVLGMVGLLADTPLDEDQREMVRVAQNSAESLLTVINDILDFSKIEAGKLRFDPGDFDLLALAEETLALLGPRAHQKSLELVGDFAPELAGRFLGDAGRIRQVLTNLIGNAIKFTPAGEVRVTGRVVREDEPYALVRISVEDTGIGIAPAAQGRLFQAFSQADGSTTRRFGGTGLGLAISRQLVALMGGEIGFESEPDAGSLFWFEVPLPRCPAAPPLSDSSPVVGRRVLVVDDNGTNLRVLAGQLRRCGVAAETLTNGPAALARLRAAAAAGEPFDAALIDSLMPGMSGLELARAIGRDAAIATTPLVLLSSSGEGRQEAQQPGANFAVLLVKPVSEAQLLSALRRALPSAPDQAAPQAPLKSSPRPAVEPGRQLHVLLVEDTPANQIVGRMLLEKMGHTTELAEDGPRALARLAVPPPFDVVLMDCQMPGMDGYEVTRRIRAGAVSGIDPRVPIVALTAYAMPEDRAKCLAAGMDDYLSKPIDPDELRSLLARRGLVSVPPPASPRAPEAPSPLDARAVAMLQSLPGRHGPSLWPEMVAMFTEQEPAVLAELDRLAEARDGVALAAAAHRLAGSCASVGARTMQSAARAIELGATQSDWPAVARGLADLASASTGLHAALRAALAVTA